MKYLVMGTPVQPIEGSTLPFLIGESEHYPTATKVAKGYLLQQEAHGLRRVSLVEVYEDGGRCVWSEADAETERRRQQQWEEELAHAEAEEYRRHGGGIR
jgi:hypothetical protein